MKKFILSAFALCLGPTFSFANDFPSLQGKTPSMIIGFAAGGGTDIYGRLVASYLGKYLPGSPTIVVRNIPGAGGITAMNYLVEQVAPDGLTLTMASNSAADPAIYKRPQAKFNPLEFEIVGGVVRGGEVLLISKDAKKRLYDKTKAPVIMGAPAGVPRSGMLMTAWGIEYLGWNAKWVLGYRGTDEVMLALERNEIEMTSTGNTFLVNKLVSTGNFEILAQTGMPKDGKLVGRVDFGDAPVFSTWIEGKITDPAARKGFDYWSNLAVTDKWLALPPKSPKEILDMYRTAYMKVINDEDFIERAKKISDDIIAILPKDVQPLIENLAQVPPEAIQHNAEMLQRQGLPTE
jgi:tripartite-type tricarboxylate transporter receptor subunit TctC